VQIVKLAPVSGGIDKLRREVEREQKQAERNQRRSARRQRRGRRIRIAGAAVTLTAVTGITAWCVIARPWEGSTPSAEASSVASDGASASAAASPQAAAEPRPSDQLTVTPPAPPGPFPPPADQAGQELGQLVVARNQDSGSYQRSAFGPGWGGYGYYPKLPDGCEARDEVLRRDLSDVKAGDRNACIIFSGVLHDPYTGKELPYSRYQASDIEIDHVVALGAAWRSGAAKWSGERRLEFANDINNMLAVDKRANNDKSSKTPDQWRPPEEGYWCQYAERWVGIKSRYGLTVTAAEKTALEQMLAACG
jgi:hypothetical protein